MKKELFLEDLKKIYLLLEERQKELNCYFDIIKDKKADSQRLAFCDNFLKSISLEPDNETRLAAVNRLVLLREDALIQELEKRDFSQEDIDDALEKSYIWVRDFYLKEHQKLLHKINSLKLLSQFYRTLFDGIHQVGEALSRWQIKWHNHIIKGVNRELYELFNGDEEKIFYELNEKKLFERDEDGKKADRSYSVLVKDEDDFKALSYKDAFRDEVGDVVQSLNVLKLKLSVLEDEIYNQKEEYLSYIECLIKAFDESNRENLIKRWADVDRAWMKITTPFQVGHPLEYYEDHYRKAVALEWDIRLSNPKYPKSSPTREKIEKMFTTLFNTLNKGEKFSSIKNATLKNLKKIQLYIGRPMLFYAAEFNGLFSAQVVPNDEKVSSEYGKKIFAFSDNILESQKAKPTLKIHKMIFGKEFLDIEKDIIFHKPELWQELYDITTIGHEFGHILWMDSDTETKMNQTGNFKNIEEFKATTGGLNAFFTKPKESLKEFILRDIAKRAITLIAWMQTAEVEPYYCEGLIHLDILFKSDVLRFDNKKLTIDISKESYDATSKIYQEVYKELAEHYLKKADASIFLKRFALKEGKYFMPTDKSIKSFVEYYWKLHKEIGRVIA